MDNSNKYILITGASKGIGRAIAIVFARNSFPLVLISRNKEKLNETLELCVDAYKKSGNNYNSKLDIFVPIISDVSDYSSLEGAKKELEEKNILVSCVINNAGIEYFGLLQDMSADEWNKVINTNLSSIFYTSKLFIPDFLKLSYGQIINVSSVWGNVGASCEVAYSATKGGVNAFTKSLAKELALSNIRVNAIACGAIDTDMNGRLSDDERHALLNEIPINRMGKPDEVASMVYSIYSSPSYLTGQIITFDGGWI